MIEPDALDNHAVLPGQLQQREPEELTHRQREVLAVCEAFFHATGEPCSVPYLARRLAVHHSTIQEHLEALHRKGWLQAPTTTPRRGTPRP